MFYWLYVLTFNSSCGRLGPCLDAAEVEDVIASVTAPHSILSTNRVTAHHTLVRACRQLLYQQGYQNKDQNQPYKIHNTFMCLNWNMLLLFVIKKKLWY